LVSLNSRLESNKEEKLKPMNLHGTGPVPSVVRGVRDSGFGFGVEGVRYEVRGEG